jgi:hypothetical protein
MEEKYLKLICNKQFNMEEFLKIYNLIKYKNKYGAIFIYAHIIDRNDKHYGSYVDLTDEN